jgi:hypothetical protein
VKKNHPTSAKKRRVSVKKPARRPDFRAAFVPRFHARSASPRMNPTADFTGNHLSSAKFFARRLKFLQCVWL